MKVICITPLDHIPDVLKRLRAVSDVEYTPRISKERLREKLLSSTFDAIFTNPNKQDYILDNSLLKGTSVKLINTASTGLNHIDLKDCEQLGIKVLSLTKDYDLIRKLPSTSELAFGLALAMMRKIPQSHKSVLGGQWNYEPFVGRQLSGMTAGIVGYGRLGTFMAKYCESFGMEVIVCDPYKNVFNYDQVTLEEVMERSDLISLHVHVKEDTFEMINRKTIDMCVKSPYLVNTSRGEIVSEPDVCQALISKKISGYGTDVLVDEFSNEAFLNKNDLINLSKEGYNVIVTPHIGGMSIEGQTRAYQWAVKKFEDLNV